MSGSAARADDTADGLWMVWTLLGPGRHLDRGRGDQHSGAGSGLGRVVVSARPTPSGRATALGAAVCQAIRNARAGQQRPRHVRRSSGPDEIRQLVVRHLRAARDQLAESTGAQDLAAAQFDGAVDRWIERRRRHVHA
jgi:hypothetical protein